MEAASRREALWSTDVVTGIVLWTKTPTREMGAEIDNRVTPEKEKMRFIGQIAKFHPWYSKLKLMLQFVKATFS